MRRGDGAWGWLSRRASVEGAAREAPEDEGANGTSEALANRLDRNLVSLTSPDSEAADQYRLLFHRLRRAEMDQGECLRVVAVTSATDGEGKSLTAANLALIAAGERVSERVLLVDADLRRPSWSEHRSGCSFCRNGCGRRGHALCCSSQQRCSNSAAGWRQRRAIRHL